MSEVQYQEDQDLGAHRARCRELQGRLQELEECVRGEQGEEVRGVREGVVRLRGVFSGVTHCGGRMVGGK